MGTSTVYDVAIRYRLSNQATADAERLRNKLGETHHKANELSHVLSHIGMIAGGAMSIHGAWEHLVKFNSEVENAKISLAAMVEGGFGGSFEYAKGQAESLYKEFQKFSTQTPMTTQEMLEFSRGVAVATQQAGGSIQDIVNVTEQGAIAAKALGMESHYAAREIAEMLSGNVNNRMLFAKQLAGLGGKSTEDIRAMGAGERLAFLKQTLNSPAMKDAVSSMSQSFSGVTSTLIDKVQILLGKVGLPLFKAITAEVSRWNAWIDNNNVAIDQFAHTVAVGLVDAFGVVKDVFSFIYDHAETFMAIGKVWAAIKLGNMAGGMMAGMLGGGGGLGKDIKGFGGALGAVAPALAVGFGAYELANATGMDKLGERLGASLYTMIHGSNDVGNRFDRLMKSSEALDQAFRDAASRMGGTSNMSLQQGSIAASRTEADTINALIKAQSDLDGMRPMSEGYAQALAHLSDVKDAARNIGIDTGASTDDLRRQQAEAMAHANAIQGRGEFVAGGAAVLIEALERSSLTEYQRSTLNEQKAMNEVFGEINRKLAAGGSIFDPALVGEILKTLRDNTADPEGRHKAIAEKAKVNVTIHRIEVQSDDPDRYVFRFVQTLRDSAKNPSQAVAVLREG